MALCVWFPTISIGCTPRLTSAGPKFAAARQDGQLASLSPRSSQISMARKEATLLRVATSHATGRGQSGVGDDGREMSTGSIIKLFMRQEDSIIINLFERIQYPFNRPIYDSKQLTIPGFGGTLVEYLLKKTEQLHAEVGRYTSPEEHPFFPDGLPESVLPEIQKPKFLHKAADEININPLIWKIYFDDLLPVITSEGDDGNYGSTATCDVVCLPSLSKIIHFEKFLAEAAFRDAKPILVGLIRAEAVELLEEIVNQRKKERQRRMEQKAIKYRKLFYEATESSVVNSRPQAQRIDPELFTRLYCELVTPLVKKVFVEYLMHRLD